MLNLLQIMRGYAVRKWIGYTGLAAVAFLLLCVMFPDDRRASAAEELCGDGKRLMSQAGATAEEARRLGCDHKAAQAGYDALYEREHGS